MSRPLVSSVFCLLAGCVFPSSPLFDGTGDGLTSGGSDLYVEWWAESEWDGGACYRMAVQTAGRDLDWWDLEVTTANTWNNFIGGYGPATVEPWGTTSIGILPDEGALVDGQTVEVSYCTEPAAAPQNFRATTVAAQSSSSGSNNSSSSGSWGSSSGGSSSGGSSSGGSSSGDYEYGGFTSNGWGVAWKDAGESRGGECLEFQVVNLTGSDQNDWYAVVELDRAADVTDAWGLSAFTFGEPVLQLTAPSWESGDLDHRAAAVGTVCLAPTAEPIGFTVYSESAGGTSGGSSDPSDLYGELYDSGSDWGMRYTSLGEGDYGLCYQLSFLNVSGRDASDWSGTLEWSNATSVTRIWNIEGTTRGTDTLDFFPISSFESVDDRSSVDAGVCVWPAATPVALDITATR